MSQSKFEKLFVLDHPVNPPLESVDKSEIVLITAKCDFGYFLTDSRADIFLVCVCRRHRLKSDIS